MCITRKGALLKIPVFCSDKTKNIRHRSKNIGYWLHKQKPLFTWVIAAHINIGKTSVSKILKNVKTLQKEYWFFKGRCKNTRQGEYHLINEILINWYKKCPTASLFPDSPMLKEEGMLIKERSNKDDLTSFTALNDWLELVYGVHETRIKGESDSIRRRTIQSWIECLFKLTTDHELDELGLCSIALPEKSPVQMSRSCKGGKTSNQGFTAAFFVAAYGFIVSVAVRKSKSSRCFQNIWNKSRQSMVHYSKSWMRTEVMENDLGLFDWKLCLEGKNAILSW